MPRNLRIHGMCQSSKESLMKSPFPEFGAFCLHNQYRLLETASSPNWGRPPDMLQLALLRPLILPQ